jgi:hypothetical protein
MRYWLPAHAGFLAVADQNPSFTGCPTFTRQLTKLMPKRKICLSFLLGNCHDFIATDARAMGFPNLASAPACLRQTSPGIRYPPTATVRPKCAPGGVLRLKGRSRARRPRLAGRRKGEVAGGGVL